MQTFVLSERRRKQEKVKVLASETLLEYSGRIDFDDPQAPEFVYPCSYVKMRFTGASLKVIIRNRNDYWDNYLGVILDGVQSKIKIRNENEAQTLLLAEELSDGEHEVMLFKRQDSCHVFCFAGFEIGGHAKVLPLPPKPNRRIEVYGDSVSAGEVSEAVEFVGKSDPEWHRGELSNSWYSYAWMTARRLNAELYDIAQGGIALLDHTGWFQEPNALGMESVYDKIQYNPRLGAVKRWDFYRYRPHVVIVAIGQNDAHPADFMREDYDGRMASYWRKRYGEFVAGLRKIYPKAEIILTTTILEHDASWDRAIAEVCRTLADQRIHHFLYTLNGIGTPGHIRISEAEKMAEELAAYIDSLGSQIWEETHYESN